MDKVIDRVVLEEFFSPEILSALDPGEMFSAFEQQPSTSTSPSIPSAALTSNPGPSQKPTECFSTITEQDIQMPLRIEFQSTHEGILGWNGTRRSQS